MEGIQTGAHEWVPRPVTQMRRVVVGRLHRKLWEGLHGKLQAAPMPPSHASGAVLGCYAEDDENRAGANERHQHVPIYLKCMQVRRETTLIGGGGGIH